MVWAGANYPQEYDSTPPSDCGHEGVKYAIRSDDEAESISCADCIADELATLKQGVPVDWRIERLTDDDVTITDHEFVPARVSGEDMCTYSWRVESERTYCQRPRSAHSEGG
jgi:hypothetical protein